MFQDHSSLNTKVSVIHEETKENDRQIKILTESSEKNKKDIENLYKLSSNFRREMEELSDKVTELYILKKQIEVNFVLIFISRIIWNYIGPKSFH